MTEPQSVRKIIHIDMDCFYAAIEMRDNPSLAALPVAVGGSTSQRGVLCTCNYLARKYGVRSAMASATARRLCPDLVLLPVDMAKYKQVSARIFTILRDFSSLVEPLSLDEAYLDVTASPLLHGSATLIAEAIKDKIWQSEQLSASAGVAPNKFLAKIASSWQKPNGICVIRPEQVSEFIHDLAVTKLFGVGRVTANRLQQLKITTCNDLQSYSLNNLILNFGKFGNTLYYQARGIDNRPVEPNRPRKSLSVEQTFADDISDDQQALTALAEVFADLRQRLAELSSSRALKSQFVKIKFANFQQTTAEQRSNQLDFGALKKLFHQARARHHLAIRLLGLGVSFAAPEKADELQPELFITASDPQ